MSKKSTLLPKESEIKKAILEYLKFVPDCSIFPIATTGIYDPVRKSFRKSTMRLGTPDILCCIDGHFVAIEVKTGSGKMSSHQKAVAEDISKCKGLHLIARSVDEVRDFIHANGFV